MEFFESLEPSIILLLFFIALFAGYIDAIAGGGGVIQVPALLLCGVSPVAALATNKVVSMVGTSFVVLKYALNRLIRWRYVLLAGIPCFLGSIIGSKIAIVTPEWLLEVLIIASILIALIFSRIVKAEEPGSTESRNQPAFLAWLTTIGVYDGVAGPGTGSFMALAVNRSLKYNLLTATAIAKPINLMTNIAATLVFVFADKVLWEAAVPMLIANALGGWIGGHMAMSKGSIFIKRLLSVVLATMLTANIGKLLLNF